MSLINSSKTSLNIYQTTWCCIPEDSHLHIHCPENLKSQKGSFYLCSWNRLQNKCKQIKQYHLYCSFNLFQNIVIIQISCTHTCTKELDVCHIWGFDLASTKFYTCECTRADQKYLGQNLLYENESIYKLLEVVSFKVQPSRLYAAIPVILPLFNACLVGLFRNGLQLPCRI
jgi:hypothetical protein